MASNKKRFAFFVMLVCLALVAFSLFMAFGPDEAVEAIRQMLSEFTE